jgi:hypothetical protein
LNFGDILFRVPGAVIRSTVFAIHEEWYGHSSLWRGPHHAPALVTLRTPAGCSAILTL